MDAETPHVPAPRWRGVNHLALVTGDMDTTVRFYHGCAGSPARRDDRDAGIPALLLRVRRRELPSRSSSTAGSRWSSSPSRRGSPTRSRSQFDHLSFDLADEHALLELRDRLKRAGCEVTDVVDHGIMRSIYFTDPNGIALEASWWTTDPTGRAELSFDDASVFVDPTPVDAVRELSAGGLERIPGDPLGRRLHPEARRLAPLVAARAPVYATSGVAWCVAPPRYATRSGLRGPRGRRGCRARPAVRRRSRRCGRHVRPSTTGARRRPQCARASDVRALVPPSARCPGRGLTSLRRG